VNTGVEKRVLTCQEYYFDGDKLAPGKPPCDRGCRLCGHIGHLRDECPERRRGNQEQQKPKKKSANANQKQGKRNQDDRSTASTPKDQEESVERRSKVADDAPAPGDAADKRPDDGNGADGKRGAASAPAAAAGDAVPSAKTGSPAPSAAAKSAEKAAKLRSANRKAKQAPGKPTSSNPEDAKANDAEKKADGNAPPKVRKEKKNMRKSWRKSNPEGAETNDKTEPKAAAKDSGDAPAAPKKVPKKPKSEGQSKAPPTDAPAATN